MQRTITLFLFVLSFVTLKAQVIPSDSVALVALYNSTNGAQWINKSNWLSQQQVSDWYGVMVSDGRVLALYLQNNNLTGTLPAEFGSFSGMTYIDLSSNKLEGSIPESIGQCTELRELYFGNNKLTGNIPTSLSQCSKLRVLSLASNQFSINFPDAIISLTGLESLDLSSNQFNGPVPSGISQLTNLLFLDISRNNLSGSMPSIKDLDLLSECHLSYNYLTGDIADFFDYKTNMYYFTISGNQFSGHVSESYFESGKLQYFDLQENKFTSLGDFSAFAAGGLKRLNVYGNEFPFEDLEPNRLLSNFTYAPQAHVLDSQTVSLLYGESYMMHSGSAGEFTSYQWYHNGVAIPGATNADYQIESFQPSDAGVYMAEMTNSELPLLTLRRNPVTILDGTTSTFELAHRSIAIYPNPATDQITINDLFGEKVRVYSAKGEMMYNGSANDRIDVSSWPLGEYFVVEPKSRGVGKFMKVQ